MRTLAIIAVLFFAACTFEVAGDGGGPIGVEFEGGADLNGTLFVEGETEHNIWVHGLGMEEDNQGCRLFRKWREKNKGIVHFPFCDTKNFENYYGDYPDLVCMGDIPGCQAFWGFYKADGLITWCAHVGTPDCTDDETTDD